MSASANWDSSAPLLMPHADLGVADGIQCLSWIVPGAASLAALAQLPPPQAWSALAVDPAAVLLILRQTTFTFSSEPCSPSFSALLDDPAVLLGASGCLGEKHPAAFISWHHPHLRPVYQASRAYATLATSLARHSGQVSPELAWICGLLAPLGWIVVASIAPHLVFACLRNSEHAVSPSSVEQRLWGMDQHAIARRILRRWELPAWLQSVLSPLSLTGKAARAIGGDPTLLQHIQVAIHLAREHGIDLGLVERPVAHEAAQALGLSRDLLQAALAEVEAIITLDPPISEDPRRIPLLPDLLAVARENQLLRRGTLYAQLEAENDRLHQALAIQARSEADRVRQDRLAGLAELAAGAGHEINNPLAVISGQAQYLLGHDGTWFSGPEAEKIRDALQAIIAQTRRIHGLLKDLMLFARPGAPRRQSADLPTLLGEVASACREAAALHRVDLQVHCLLDRLSVDIDVDQIRLALTGLVRNAIEAASPDGWVRLILDRVPSGSAVKIVVEDSGPGPSPAQEAMLFDPFFSGRPAGRGRGMGLPIAWRLARLHDGDVQLEPPLPNQPARFVLRLPLGAACVGREEDDFQETEILRVPSPCPAPAVSSVQPAPKSASC